MTAVGSRLLQVIIYVNLRKLPQNVTRLYIDSPPPLNGVFVYGFTLTLIIFLNLGGNERLGGNKLGGNMDICANNWISLTK